MTDNPSVDEATFRVAMGEDLEMPEGFTGIAQTTPTGAAGTIFEETRSGVAHVGLTTPPAGVTVESASYGARRRTRKLRARKVRRLVRHVEPWSALKIALIFYLCLWGIMLIAGTILWSLAVSSGTVENLEEFVTELFALESFTINADLIFRLSAIGGLVMVMFGAGFTVVMAVLFNLISDLTGGLRLTVVEEETARLRPKRLRPRTAGRRGLQRQGPTEPAQPSGPA